MITDPRYMEFQDWADQLMIDLEPYGDAPWPETEDVWREWAQNLLLVPGLAIYTLPQPSYFPDWRSWAEMFVGALK